MEIKHGKIIIHHKPHFRIPLRHAVSRVTITDPITPMKAHVARRLGLGQVLKVA